MYEIFKAFVSQCHLLTYNNNTKIILKIQTKTYFMQFLCIYPRKHHCKQYYNNYNHNLQ